MSLAPREVRHRRSHLGWHHRCTCSGVDHRACASRDPSHQPLPPRRNARLRGVVVVAHVPPRSAVALPQPLPPHRRAQLKGLFRVHLKETLPRSCPPPLEIRRRDRCHLAVVHTLWARRRVHALEIRCRSRSHLAVVHASGGLRRALASGIRRRERVPRIPRRARLSEVGA